VTKEQIEELIAAIEEGRCWGMKERDFFIIVARRTGVLVCECGWVVPEAYGDDHLVTAYHPFKGGSPRPWVGRSVSCDTPSDAATVYAQMEAAVCARKRFSGGAVIGSVARRTGVPTDYGR
jgi:hypothetical protein